MGFIIEKLTKDKYKDWDNFCSLSQDAWFWHTSSWLEYNLNYRPERQPISKSFFLIENKKIIAICPLLLENNRDNLEFSFGGGYGPVPAIDSRLLRKQREKIIKAVFKQIDRLAAEHDVKRASFRFVVLNKSFLEAREKFNYLLKFDYLDNSLNTQILYLKKSLAELKSDLRHGHNYDIKLASKSLTSEIFDIKNITNDIFNEYVSLHQKAAGRITRSTRTFVIMHELISSGENFLVGAKRDGNFIGFSYFFVYKNNVYYGSSCNDPKISDLPISHFSQWEAIKWMKLKNYDYYELGWQQYGNSFFDYPSEKEILISRFKRGFGGFTLPLFRGEKYYDKNYFLTAYQERIKKYAEKF